MNIVDKFYWGMAILCILISIPIAFKMSKDLHNAFPDLKPYAWGYYIGLSGALSSSVFSVVMIVIAININDSRSSFYFAFSVLFAISTVAHFFIIKRNKWAWVIGIILELNLVLWVINSIYLKNRWAELSPLKIERHTNYGNKISFVNRALIAGSVFWVLIALAFVFIFEPYGNYVSERDWWQVAKIIVFPIVVVVLGYFLYFKVIQQKD